MLSIGEDLGLKQVMEACRDCAQSAKALIASTKSTYEVLLLYSHLKEFFEACKNFGGSSLSLAKVIQDQSQRYSDKVHQQKLVNAYNNIKEVGPQLIRAAKKGI